MTGPDDLFAKVPFNNTIDLPVGWWGIMVDASTFQLQVNRPLQQKLEIFKQSGIKFSLVEPVWLPGYEEVHNRIVARESMVERKGYLQFASESEAVQFKLLFAEELR